MNWFKLLTLILISFCFQTSASSVINNLLDEFGGAKINFNFSLGSGTQFKGITFGSTANENTEASHSFDNSKNDFCCEREYTNESAHDMSEEASQRVVQNLLLNPEESHTPTVIQPNTGQR